MGRVEKETRRVREMVEATTAKARSVRGDVESRVATLAVAADMSAARTAEEISSRVKEVVEYSDAQASRITADVTQRLEKEIVAAATSTTATAEVMTRTVVEGIRRDIQAQLEQNRADALRREQEAQHRVEEISRQLQNLTDQLNRFQPASEHTVGVAQGQVTEQLQKKFDAQTERMDQLTATVVESQKSAQTNSEVLQNLLVGIENLGENFKTMQAEMIAWQGEYQNAEGEYQRMNAELLQEVPLASEAELRPRPVNPPTISFPPVISTQFTVPAVISTPQSSGKPWRQKFRQGGLICLRSGNHILGHRPQQIGFQRELMYQNLQSKILKLLFLNSLILLGQALVCHNR